MTEKPDPTSWVERAMSAPVPERYLHYRIVAAAREWLEERVPKDHAEKQLMVTLYDAFPRDFSTGKDFCSCEDKDDCDECMTSAEVKAVISHWRDECAEPWRDPVSVTPEASPTRDPS